MLYCCSKKIVIDSEHIFKIITIFAVISSFFSISQYFHFQDFVPLDNTRGRGLSRSTLNYSSLMLMGYISADHCKRKFSKISKVIILTGAICALGRGGVISILIYEFIKNIKQFKIIIKILIVIVLFFLILSLLKQQFDFQLNSLHSGFSLMFDKFYYSLDFEKDSGNAQRIQTYKLFFDYFEFFGSGFGTTGTAAARFTNEWFGFESTGLAILYQSGKFFLLIGPILIFGAIISNRPLTFKKIAIFASYLAIIFAQQTFETPVVNIVAWITLLACINIDKSLRGKELKF